MKSAVLTLALVLGGFAAQANDLSITFLASNVPLIDATTRSCDAVATMMTGNTNEDIFDVHSRYFQLYSPQIHWANTTRTLVVSKIIVDVNAPNYQTCTIGSTELAALFASGTSATTYTPWDTMLTSASTKETWGACNTLTCGEYPQGKAVSSAYKGTVKVIGYSIGGNGDEQPEEATATVTITDTAE